MVLGKLPVLGRPTIWITVGQGPTALVVAAGRSCLDIFTLIYTFFPLSPSLWETARYRLKYCLKGPLNPKPTSENIFFFLTCFVRIPARNSMSPIIQTTWFTRRLESLILSFYIFIYSTISVLFDLFISIQYLCRNDEKIYVRIVFDCWRK